MKASTHRFIDNAIGAVIVGIATVMFAGPFGLILFAPAVAGL